MAERVPLTDAELDAWVVDVESPIQPAAVVEGFQRLVAELRAAHARVAELERHAQQARVDAGLNAARRDVLQQRIDKALAAVSAWEDDDSEMSIFELGQWVRAALTGAESGADPSAGAPSAGSLRRP
jgi:ATPase subunit of ABC transporter with duplicated ATPase domains